MSGLCGKGLKDFRNFRKSRTMPVLNLSLDCLHSFNLQNRIVTRAKSTKKVIMKKHNGFSLSARQALIYLID